MRDGVQPRPYSCGCGRATLVVDPALLHPRVPPAGCPAGDNGERINFDVTWAGGTDFRFDRLRSRFEWGLICDVQMPGPFVGSAVFAGWSRDAAAVATVSSAAGSVTGARTGETGYAWIYQTLTVEPA